MKTLIPKWKRRSLTSKANSTYGPCWLIIISIFASYLADSFGEIIICIRHHARSDVLIFSLKGSLSVRYKDVTLARVVWLSCILLNGTKGSCLGVSAVACFSFLSPHPLWIFILLLLSGPQKKNIAASCCSQRKIRIFSRVSILKCKPTQRSRSATFL